MWWKVKLNAVAESLLSFVLPQLCLYCGREVSADTPFCNECMSGIRPSIIHRCIQCGKKIESHSERCIDCLKNKPCIDRLYVWGEYDGILKEAIIAMKFKRLWSIPEALAEMVDISMLPMVDSIMPVPLSKERLLTRGFNQSFLIAKVLGRKLSVQVHTCVLLKIKDNPPQSLLKGRQRLVNPRNTYRVTSLPEGCRHVLLVDDVATTGATLNECARVLKKAGVERVYGFVLAK